MTKTLMLRLSGLFPIAAVVCAIMGPRLMGWSTAESRGMIKLWIIMCVVGLGLFIVGLSAKSGDGKRPVGAMVIGVIGTLIGIAFTAISFPYMNS